MPSVTNRVVTGSLLLCVMWLATVAAARPRFAISFPATLHRHPLDGRILLIISTDSTQEPRFQIDNDAGPRTQQLFGIDVEGLEPGETAVIDTSTFGFPRSSVALVPRGVYWVQALLHRYETFHRADGHTVKMAMDRGEGQQWNRAPGNFFSIPFKIHFDPAGHQVIHLSLDREIPPLPPPRDTKYVRHVRVRSERLSRFWGRDFYLGASVLLPYGFDEHPEARYPLVVYHGHFSPTFVGFRESPPDSDLIPEYSHRFNVEAYNRIEQEYAYRLFQDWVSPSFPRVIVIDIQHANPYYDDSYAVNSANLGPYGDAIMDELIPYVEKKFRGIGQGWARFTYGGSTGGWESLAAQIFYPDEFNGCFAACPDPVDFRAYTIVNIYEHENAYYQETAWKRTPRPGRRNSLGEVSATLEELNHFEFALGSNGRSGQQWDIWQAVFSPVDDNGFPKPIWDKKTGTIDRSVALYWRDHYDLRFILARDWKTLGPKLEGKLHVYCGDMDNYYLNNAVYLLEDFLKATRNPFYGGEVDYGDRAEHCWNGDHSRPIWLSRLRYHQMFIPRGVDRLLSTAPPGADLTSWRY